MREHRQRDQVAGVANGCGFVALRLLVEIQGESLGSKVGLRRNNLGTNYLFKLTYASQSALRPSFNIDDEEEKSMNADVPYMLSVSNLHKILDAIQRAGAPEVFHLDFLKDLGFSSSNDRGAVKLLKYLGMLDESGRPLGPYREFMDHNRAKQILAARMRVAFDDLFTADRNANAKSVESLKGWFKTKTGSGDAVAQKIASTFRSLASYADFSSPPIESAATEKVGVEPPSSSAQREEPPLRTEIPNHVAPPHKSQIGLVYRFEIHLPETQNVDTYRAIFKALREELM